MAVRVNTKNFFLSIIYCIVLVILVFVIGGIINSSREKNAKEFSKYSKPNETVYADILSIDPIEATVEKGKVSQSYQGFFCTCETADGNMINAYISSSNFDKYIKKADYDWDTWQSTMPNKVVFDTPLHIIGVVKMTNDIIASRDVTLVLEIHKSDRKTE